MGPLQHWSLIFLMCVLSVVRAAPTKDDAVPDIGVSIEDFIDLDSPPASSPREGNVLTSQTGSGGDKETTVGHGDFRIAPGLGPAPPPIQVLKSDIIKPSSRRPPVTSDDEDAELSGDGSGSGDEAEEETDVVTPFTAKNATSMTSQSGDQGVKVNVTVDIPHDLVIGEGGSTVTDEVDNTVTSDANITIGDVMYTADVWPPVPVKEQTDEGEEIQRWSPWIRTNDVTEVRIRTCNGNAESCNGTEAELRQCDRESNRCDVMEAVVMSEAEVEAAEERAECSDNDDHEQQKEEPDQVIQPVEKPRSLPPGEIDLQRTELEPCTYSLFDVKRGKYLVTQWSLTRLVTQAKVKKWCARPQDYLVFHSPHAHCQRYYKDLCHVSMRCKGSRTPPKERGDFAEGCWRQFVYGSQLPVGLSNRQTIVYLICQRYAAMSTLGKIFGHKRSHFATLYDTKGRAPVVSLVKLTEMGDESWPSTPYFIEHGWCLSTLDGHSRYTTSIGHFTGGGFPIDASKPTHTSMRRRGPDVRASLVEDTEDKAWYQRSAKKGMVRLQDMGKCQDEDSCQLGSHQALPSDYSATTYRTAHLIWPELAGPDPLSRLSTFTMTNTAPMHAALYPAWHRAVMHVRQFALQQCGVPQISPAQFMSNSHRGHKHRVQHHYYSGVTSHQQGPAIYIASGVIPSHDPTESIGNDINVPFMFWMAACCLVENSTTNTKHHHNDYANFLQDDASGKTLSRQHSSFAIYARNTGSGSLDNGSTDHEQGLRGQVVSAPVLQLELLLQDIYKTLPTDPDVNLFPASYGACSELRNDYSRNVHL